MTGIPSTVSYIGYHAATAPAQVAVVDGGRPMTYRDFHRDIARMTGALTDLGIRPGQSVAVEITGFYRHWVMLLACEALGASSLSYNQSELPVLGTAIAAMDHVICGPGAEPEQASALHVADHDWLTAVARRPETTLPPTTGFDADAPLRMVKSYGTMGVLELMVHTGRVHDFWLRQFRFRTTLNRGSRYLLTAGFGVQAFHVHATSCIRMGGTVICGNPNEIAVDFERYKVTHATFMPAQLEQLLQGQGAVPLDPRLEQIFTIGAPASKGVRDRTRQILAQEISESYGTNEAGGIASMDDDGIGTVFPGVAVEVLDDDGNPVLGSQGRIRLRSAGVVDGYWRDSETTGRMFRDGWFYPGDIGVLYDHSRLTLAGRVEDYLTVGGAKYPLDILEKKLLEVLPALDICLLANPADTDAAVTMLILSDKRLNADRIRQEAATHLPQGLSRITVVEARNIPRGTDGKVQRAKLSWQLTQAMGDGNTA